jgi:hypothetical protein
MFFLPRLYEAQDERAGQEGQQHNLHGAESAFLLLHGIISWWVILPHWRALN